MREILFRGKSIDDSKWIEGFYAKTSQRWSDEVIHFIFTEEDIDDYLIVDPETVGQYAGRKDCNGKLVFDGDIITGNFPSSKIGLITWDEKRCGFFVKPIDTWNNQAASDKYYKMNSVNFEVIGNRWDNPELLEEV